jgi:hypothetical protein
VKRTINSSYPKPQPVLEALYDKHPQTGASMEVLYADRVLALSFGTCSGWFWWMTVRQVFIKRQGADL